MASAPAGGGGMGGLGWMQAASSFLEIWGTHEAARMERAKGERARIAAQFNAWNSDQLASETLAASQRQALEEKRRGRYDASRALAVAAASGAAVNDPTMVRILTDAQGEAAYRAATALYEGESRARQLRIEGITGRHAGYEAEAEGASRAMGLSLQGAGRGIRAMSSLYARYGRGGPGGSGDDALIRSDTRSSQYPDL